MFEGTQPRSTHQLYSSIGIAELYSYPSRFLQPLALTLSYDENKPCVLTLTREELITLRLAGRIPLAAVRLQQAQLGHARCET